MLDGAGSTSYEIRRSATVASATTREILELEEKLRQAELGPDPHYFERHLDGDALLDGQKAKAKVVSAHQPGGTAKFTRVEMSEMQVIDHGDSAVVTCLGAYEGTMGKFALRFMRVWVKKHGEWRIIEATVAKG
jgi:hypothetical protein